MRRLTAAIAAAAVLSTVPVLASPAEARVSAKTCRYQGLDPAWWSDREVVRIIECWTRKLEAPTGGVPIASRETGGTFYPRAYNATGCNGHGCLGIFQMHALYYPGWAADVKPWHRRLVRDRSWDNPRWNALVAVTKARRERCWCSW